MLVDAPERKIAIFSNQLGHISIASQENGMQSIATICPDEFCDFEALFLSAKTAAIETDSAQAADIAIWCAKRGLNDR